MHVTTERITLKKRKLKEKCSLSHQIWFRFAHFSLFRLCGKYVIKRLWLTSTACFIGLNADCPVSSDPSKSRMIALWCLNKIANTLKTKLLNAIFKMKSDALCLSMKLVLEGPVSIDWTNDGLDITSMQLSPGHNQLNLWNFLGLYPLISILGRSTIWEITGIVLCMPLANERRRYIGWADAQNYPWDYAMEFVLVCAVMIDRCGIFEFIITASNGKSVRVTGHLCGEFTGPRWIPAQRPVTRGFDVFFDLHPDKRLSKQSWGW